MKSASFKPRHTAALVVLGLGLSSLAVFAAGPGGAAPGDGDAAREPVRCELSISERPGQTVIGGHVSSDRPVSGSYRMGITSRGAGGSASIDQSGDFTAGPGAPALLGETVLGGSPSRYRAELEIGIEGRWLGCPEAKGRAAL